MRKNQRKKQTDRDDESARVSQRDGKNERQIHIVRHAEISRRSKADG